MQDEDLLEPEHGEQEREPLPGSSLAAVPASPPTAFPAHPAATPAPATTPRSGLRSQAAPQREPETPTSASSSRPRLRRGCLTPGSAKLKTFQGGLAFLEVDMDAAAGEEEPSPQKVPSPRKAGLSDGFGTCPPPCAKPGAGRAHVAIAPLTLAYLMSKAGLMDFEAVCALSANTQRESSLDKELVDASAVAIKLQALCLLGEETCTLAKDVFPHLRIPDRLGKQSFLVPRGHLKVDTQRPKHQLSAEQIADKVMQIRANILRSMKPGAKWEDLQIGFTGVGNDGLDSLVVLVDNTPQHYAWSLIIQSKQTSREKYVTGHDIFNNFESDTRHTHRLPRPQPEVWAKWHDKDLEAKPGQKRAFPNVEISSVVAGSVHPDVTGKVRRNALALQRLGYAYVSDGTVSAQQDALYARMVEVGHPWTDYIIVVSACHSRNWHGRMGALQRSEFRRAVTGELVA